MSLRKRAAKSNLKSPTSDYFDQQVAASDARASNATQSLKNPYTPPAPSSPARLPSGSPFAADDRDYITPSSLASSPVSTPVKMSKHEGEDDLPDLGRPTKRTKLDDDDPATPEVDNTEDEAESPITNRLTMIGSSALAKLRDDKAQLLAANSELAKDNVKLKKKLANVDENAAAENDVLRVENKRLEGSLDSEQLENVELRAENGQLRQQLVRVQRELAQLGGDYDGLVVAYNELRASIVQAPAQEPEVDLAGGFPRLF